MTQYRGRCACGQVTYATSAAPVTMINCHCRDCQRASGSAYAAIVVFSQDAVTLSGDVRYFRATSDRGTQIERGFCQNCGSPVAIKPLARPDIIGIAAASLDDPSLHKPTANIWTKSAQPWNPLDEQVPRFETRPTR